MTQRQDTDSRSAVSPRQIRTLQALIVVVLALFAAVASAVYGISQREIASVRDDCEAHQAEVQEQMAATLSECRDRNEKIREFYAGCLESLERCRESGESLPPSSPGPASTSSDEVPASIW